MKPLTSAQPWEEHTAVLFPVDLAAVPAEAVRVVRRTLLRHSPVDPMDEDLARLLVALLIGVLSEPQGAGTVEAAAGLVSEYTAATGAAVAITAR